MTLLADQRPIFRRDFQLREFFGGVEGDEENPAFAVRVGVDEGGVVLQRFIDRDNGSRDGRLDVPGGFDRFHDGGGRFGLHFGPDLGQFDINHVGQLGLGVVGDADARLAVFEADPVVCFGIFQIFGNVHVYFLWSGFF